MRDLFVGYYPPNQDELSALWDQGVIIFDTNVLLDLYRLPVSVQDEFLDVMSDISDRVWIPYHVALEFQRNRANIIASRRKAISENLNSAKEKTDKLSEIVKNLQIEKYDNAINPDGIIQNINNVHNSITDIIEKIQNMQLDLGAVDHIRDRLSVIFKDRVGPPPQDQSALEALIHDGDLRFSEKRPPGYADAHKDKNPSDANFWHDGVKYARKYGDLIIWRQVLNYVKMQTNNNVMFITSDRKEDWWWIEQGRVLGPRPELVREINKEGNVGVFWMYNSSTFLEHAKTYKMVKVSDQSVAELADIARHDALEKIGVANWIDTAVQEGETSTDLGEISKDSFFKRTKNKELILTKHGRAAYMWLKRRRGTLSLAQEFPDFVYKKNGLREGIEIINGVDPLVFENDEDILNIASRGRDEVKVDRLDLFTVLCICDVTYLEIVSDEFGIDFLSKKLAKFLKKTNIDSIIISYLDEDGHLRIFSRADFPFV